MADPSKDPHEDPFLQKPWADKAVEWNWLKCVEDDPHFPPPKPPVERGPTPTTVRCFCGSVGYSIVEPRMRTRFRCCCVDCRQAHDACASRGGRERAGAAPRDLAYFCNDVENVFGAEHVRLERLRDDAARPCETPALSLRCVATCCWSIVAVDHDAYRGNCFMVPTDACVLAAPRPLPPQKHIFVGDWDAARDGALPPLDRPANPYPTTPFVEPAATEGETLQASALVAGKPVHLLGLREGDRAFTIAAPP